ncbi:MAG: 4-hydroxythreonine-4-phosphate dehydrogenase PdxA [Proteobacteria bacterium]|nr:4-hydroxythreonine-4-phosphate dehydrogenase PdxA [Pseudomonadota bacterium]
MKPLIGITMGDPAGVGPEVTIKALVESSVTRKFETLVIGSSEVLRQTSRSLGLETKICEVDSPDEVGNKVDTIYVLNCCSSPLEYKPGMTNSMCGEYAYQAVVTASRLCRTNKISAMVTAPICKESWHQAGHKFDGHTGLLAHLTGTDDYRMMFAAEPFSVCLVTTHLPLKDVSDRLSIDTVFKTIDLSNSELFKLGIKNPKIAVCGLNPHAGEGGIFGDEDQKLIKPAIKEAEKKRIDVCGPFPADTVFIAAAQGKYDLVVAQYHDQGLIPIKLLAFDTAVNITIGLPIIRTSVDHGTAFDIAGQGIANHRNMISAIECAYKLSRGNQP